MHEDAQPEVSQLLLRLHLFGAPRATTPAGESVLPRGRKAQAILAYLALCPDAAVPRRRIVDLLWSTRWPEHGQASLRQCLIEIRTALRAVGPMLTIDRDEVALAHDKVWVDGISGRSGHGDARLPNPTPETTPTARLLETLEGLDPRFDEWIAQVRRSLAETRMALASPARRSDGAASSPPRATGGRRLLVTVAPLIQLGPAAIDDLVVPAVTQELVTALARFRWLGVRYSPAIDDGDYRVEGYLTASREGIRVVARLIDQRDRDLVVWTGESHSALPLAPDAIATLVEAIIAQLDPEILAIETRKALSGISGSQEAYSRVLRAMALLYRFEEPGWLEATVLLEEARAIDPDYARAHAVSAMCRIIGVAQGWSSDAPSAISDADREAGRAIGLDPRDSLGLALSGHIRSFVHHDFDGALQLFARALSANPSCGLAWGHSSLTHAYMGRISKASEHLARACEIMVHDPFLSHLDGFRAVIRFFARDFEGAIDACRQQLAQRPRFDNVRKLLIAALCHLNRYSEACAEDARLRAGDPGFCWVRHLAAYPFYNDADRQDLRGALARAGLLSLAEPAAAEPPRRARTDMPLSLDCARLDSRSQVETFP